MMPTRGITSAVGGVVGMGIARELTTLVTGFEEADRTMFRKNTRQPTQTKTKMKYPKKKVAKAKVSEAVKKYVKKAALLKTEIKNYNTNVANAAVTHSSFYAHAMTQGITQGLTIEDRIGDEIFLNAIRFNVFLTAPGTAGAYSYRIMLVWSGEEFNNTSTLVTTSLSAGEVMLPGYSSGSAYLAIVNRKAVTVLWDRIVDINSNVSATSDVTTVSGTLNLKNQRFAYQSAGSIYGKTKNLYFIAIPNVANGTTGTTGCGAIGITYSIDFRDP